MKRTGGKGEAVLVALDNNQTFDLKPALFLIIAKAGRPTITEARRSWKPAEISRISRIPGSPPPRVPSFRPRLITDFSKSSENARTAGDGRSGPPLLARTEKGSITWICRTGLSKSPKAVTAESTCAAWGASSILNENLRGGSETAPPGESPPGRILRPKRGEQDRPQAIVSATKRDLRAFHRRTSLAEPGQSLFRASAFR